MKCAIMQPTYLPWAGFFNLIQSVDVFVFLDDAQLSKQSWQTRNRILLNGAEHILSVPISSKDFLRPINEVRVAAGNWYKKHWKTIDGAYRKSPFFGELEEALSPVFSGDSPQLICKFNIDIITRVMDCIGLETTCIPASELACTGSRSEKLYNICRAVNCDHYLSPVGSREYLEEDEFETKYADLTLEYQQYSPAEYSQHKSDSFVSHLSFVDVMANIGFKGLRDYCREGS